MKLNGDMLFAHPVLWDVTHDFLKSRFSADFIVSIDKQKALVIESDLRLECAEMRQLIEVGAAGCGFYLICRPTYQNRLVETSLGVGTYTADVSFFARTIQIRPVIWTKEDVRGWTCIDLNREYAGRIDFPAASLVAVGDEQPFSIDNERLKPFESIFTLAALDTVERDRIEVDPDSDKIRILVHPDTKDSIDNIRNDSRGRTVLLNAVYLPAVVQVFVELAKAGNQFDSRAWHRIFVAKCAVKGVNPENAEPLRDAQSVLGLPFSRIEQQKERLFN